MTADDVLRRLTSAFDRAGIAYMLTGSFASAYYGASRSTQDGDVGTLGMTQKKGTRAACPSLVVWLIADA
jgi:hypothetical protein